MSFDIVLLQLSISPLVDEAVAHSDSEQQNS